MAFQSPMVIGFHDQVPHAPLIQTSKIRVQWLGFKGEGSAIKQPSPAHSLALTAKERKFTASFFIWYDRQS